MPLLPRISDVMLKNRQNGCRCRNCSAMAYTYRQQFFIHGQPSSACAPSVNQYDRSEQQDDRVITKLPKSEQSYKGKVKTHNYINRQNQSTTGKL